MCNAACGNGELCDAGSCKSVGLPLSCNDLINKGQTTSGTYDIDPDGSGPGQAFQVYCDMSNHGGGWTECVKVVNTAVLTTLTHSVQPPP